MTKIFVTYMLDGNDVPRGNVGQPRAAIVVKQRKNQQADLRIYFSNNDFETDNVVALRERVRFDPTGTPGTYHFRT